METGIHSGSWAVRFWTAQQGAQYSEALLFGIGRTAWYGFDWHEKEPKLQTYHPKRVLRTLIALNVTTVIYRCVTATRLLSPHAELARGFPVLLEVNAAKLTQADCDPVDQDGYCVCFLEAPNDGDNQTVRLHTARHSDTPLSLNVETFTDAWQSRVHLGLQHTLYVPMARQPTCSLMHVVPHSLSQYISQMNSGFSDDAPSGLEALRECIKCCKQDKIDVARIMRHVLEADGGPQSQRRLMSDFLLEAASIMSKPKLRNVAFLYAEIADLWEEVKILVDLRHCLKTVCNALESVLTLETMAVSTLERIAS